MRRVVVGTDEHGHMPGPGSSPERRTECCPGRPQLRRVLGQRGADLVTVGRQVVEPHLASGPIAPAEQVALLPRLAAESPPERAVLDVELGGQGRPRRRMTERVGRVEHVEPASQTSGVGGAGEQIADQRLARRDELVRQHVPGPDLQPARPHQRRSGFRLLRTCAEVVLDQDCLTVEQKRAKPRRAIEPLQNVVERGDESGQELGAGEIPLSIPVGVGNQVIGGARHGEKVAADRVA